MHKLIVCPMSTILIPFFTLTFPYLFPKVTGPFICLYSGQNSLLTGEKECNKYRTTDFIKYNTSHLC